MAVCVCGAISAITGCSLPDVALCATRDREREGEREREREIHWSDSPLCMLLLPQPPPSFYCQTVLALMDTLNVTHCGQMYRDNSLWSEDFPIVRSTLWPGPGCSLQTVDIVPFNMFNTVDMIPFTCTSSFSRKCKYFLGSPCIKVLICTLLRYNMILFNVGLMFQC